jgi:hypothetical protein
MIGLVIISHTGVALMQMSQVHYLPLAPGFFAILVGFFFIVLSSICES